MESAFAVRITQRQGELILCLKHSHPPYRESAIVGGAGLCSFQPFVGQFERFNSHIISFGLKTWPSPFCGPGVEEVPTQLFFARPIEKYDRTVLPLSGRVTS